jgi:hypothetical protein
MPARPNDRLENERLRQEAQQEEAQQEVRHNEHSDHENVAETPDNTKLFYEKLLPQAKENHKKNQRFLRTGIIWLFALPIILFIIRNMTNGNKIAFLIIWIIGMFIIAAFLIIVAYQDEALQESLDELQEYVPEVEENQLGRLKLIYPPEELEWLEDIDHEFIRETLKQEHKMPPLETIMAGHDARAVVAAEPEIEVPVVVAAEPEIEVPVVAAAEPEIEVPVVVAAEPEIEVPVVVAAEPEIEVPVVAAAEPEIEVPVVVAAEPEIEVPVVVAAEPEIEVPVVVEAEPEIEALQLEPEKPAEKRAKSELIDKISEEYKLELEAMGPEKRKPDSGKWVTEDAELMWKHINDQTFDNKGGTGDA